MPSALLDNLLLHGKQAVPAFLYGTAWRKEKTEDIIYQAILSGFKGVFTAAQPEKYYRENLVGLGIRRGLNEAKISRDNFFIQTSVNGHDPIKTPYDHPTSISEKVNTSIRSSLTNLRPSAEESSSDLTYLDCLIVHRPLPATQQTLAQTLEAWQTAETYVPHKIRYLGISNVTLDILQQLYNTAKIKPAIVQNRFYPSTQFDVNVRAFCSERSIIYQSFWILSSNPNILRGQEVRHLADKVGLTPYEAMYCLVLALDNVIILNGTTNAKIMAADLSCVQRARKWVSRHPEDWAKCLAHFKMRLGETSKSKSFQ